MSFDPKNLTQQLNENPAFRDHFSQDPQTALSQIGLSVSDEVANLLAEQMVINKSYIDDTVLGCTRS